MISYNLENASDKLNVVGSGCGGQGAEGLHLAPNPLPLKKGEGKVGSNERSGNSRVKGESVRAKNEVKEDKS